jgi:hypothetical protein
MSVDDLVSVGYDGVVNLQEYRNNDRAHHFHHVHDSRREVAQTCCGVHPMTYYDEGWNAFINGDAFDATAAFDWRSGWKDAELATKKYGKQPII